MMAVCKACHPDDYVHNVEDHVEMSIVTTLEPSPRVTREEPIRYEIQCRFCANYISGDSAQNALFNIAEHDADHATCGRCRVTRVTVPEATLCDDCYHASYENQIDAPVLTDEDAPEDFE